MRRKLHIKRVGMILAAVLVAAAAIYGLHGIQLARNAYRLLELGDRALQQKEYDKAKIYYSQYLSFIPNDADTVQKYIEATEALDRKGDDIVELVNLREQVLRMKPNESALRQRLVHNLIKLDRIPEALDHLKILLGQGGDAAELQHMRGWCLDARKDYVQAAAAFREAIKQKPEQIKSYAQLAEVLQDRLNQPDEALQVMDEMVKHNERSYRAALLRSRFHRQRQEEKKAEADLQTAMKLGQHQPEVILESAEWARAKGNTKEAVVLLEDGQKRYPQITEFYKALADVKILDGKREEAIGHLREGLAHAPHSNELAVLLIDLMIDEEKYGEAEKKIQELRKRGMRSTLPNYLTARLRMADQRWTDAIQLLEDVRQALGPRSEWNSRVHLLIGLCCRQIDDREQELLAFRRAVNDEPTWILANLGLASALMSNGRVEEAANLLEPMRNASGMSAEYWRLLARVLLERESRTPDGQFDGARVEEALIKAEALQPKSIELAILRADMLAAKKDFAGARAYLGKYQSTHPQEIVVWSALAALAARQNQWAQAEKILDQADGQKGFANRVELQLAKARLWSRHGTPEDRAKLARLSDTLEKSAPIEARTHLRRELADTWHRLGDWTRAERLWREIAQDLAKDLRSRSALLELAIQTDQGEAARKWLGEIRKIEGEQGALWRWGVASILVHEAHGQRAKLEQARNMLNQLQRHHQDWPRVVLLSARIFELEGQYQKAIQEYGRALDLGETQPRMMGRLLGLLLERQEYGKAETELAKYEQKLPLTRDLARQGAEVALGLRDRGSARLALQRAESAIAQPAHDYRDMMWLARICQAAGEIARAEKLLRDSVKSAGHTPDTWLALVGFLAQTQQRQQALAELERLRKELPQDRQPLAVARCYEAMQMPEEAGRAYQEALRAQPDDFTLLWFAADFYRRADQGTVAEKLYERLLTAELGAPAAVTVKARRSLAVLLAQHGDAGSRQAALALINENRASRGDTVTDERIRLFIRSRQREARAAALNQFEESLQSQLPTPDERLLLAQMLEETDNPAQARTHLADIADQFPMAPQYLQRYARLLIKTGELDEAQQVTTRLQALEPGSQRVRDVQTALAAAKKKAAEVP